MSRKSSTTQNRAGRAAVADTSHENWLAPLSESAPCGPDLEYDHDFVVLFAGTTPRQDVQYGGFVGSPEPLNWSEIERDCRRLMARTKDMRVAVLYARCRTRLAGVEGLADGTALLAAWLQAFPEQVHPRADIDDDRRAALEMRMNALQALADPEGLLADVREIVLTRSTAARLQVRDVERAFAHPRPIDALAPDSVALQLQNLREQQPSTMKAFDDAIANLCAIDAWCATHLETSLPDFSPLVRLLRLFQVGDAPGGTRSDTLPSAEREECEASVPPVFGDAPSAPPRVEDAQTAARTSTSVAAPASLAPTDRQAALALICAARRWFETHEPSSPIPVLLARAEQFVGKRYIDVVKAIPAELLAQWEAAEGS
ncbi:TPA: type VI secretion system ImpA family N-terminal domain-containing protein [Burkholderia multivorans]|uniref:type VI secretion system protein TssA n=1 Tax=Burkholderia multivorans TaxID=87883 RepID=UPI001C21134A|nr:type VI secretion system ImpA family N-terminal domain-containing protein [Burkholderia multivorans]MBU9350425.1 type VI secretion system ImpA family N-terminal domain-containing protein [Burkholderia multivorans]MBU9392719.1 type VI secretion system ImpA family N-terminal domain-containing protein [Burkholderia multivorans]HDR9834573.1 type VI secretion system ImpA family N-terminal domain-containing protein [Burkholderia multivorans]HDR9840987.1 type VI secretion system ImpA family N-termi